jgi:16S rRNA (guanine527-N7)-methyltransferase
MFHVKHEVPPVTQPLSSAQRSALDAFEHLLGDPGIERGLIGRGDAERIRKRHVDDSLRGALAVPAVATQLCDVGSGGGLPGVPLAIARPSLEVTLAERRRNRIDFLELVIAELGLDNVKVWAGDVHRLPVGRFDVCTARAFGDAAATWSAVEPLLSPGGRLLYWAGSSFDVTGTAVPGAHLEVSEASAVAGSGPLVIMTRQ